MIKYSEDKLFINNLLVLWLKYLAVSLYRLDDHLSKCLRAILEDTRKPDAETEKEAKKTSLCI